MLVLVLISHSKIHKEYWLKKMLPKAKQHNVMRNTCIQLQTGTHFERLVHAAAPAVAQNAANRKYALHKSLQSRGTDISPQLLVQAD